MNLKLLRQIAYMSRIVLYGIILQATLSAVLLANDGNAQTKSVEEIYLTLQVKNATLKETFHKIEEETGFLFAYTKNTIDSNDRVNYMSQANSLGDMLRFISKNAGLSFTRIGKNILVSKKATSDTTDVKEVIQEAQQFKVSGRVTSVDDGEPLPGVSILIKGTTTGTTTDIDGNYSFAVSDEAATMVVSYVGFKTQEINVGGRSIINIGLEVDVESLEEVVVVAYGSQSKQKVTGSVQKVGEDDLKDQPVAQVTQKLQGKLAGVQITQNSGIPGQGMTIRVRGQTSISAGSDPLYVVDGFPITGDISNMNPDEIESITVLKDASSTSLYGSRAANGVVIVTTKRAKANRSEFSFNAYYGLQQIPQKGRPDMMNAREFAQFKKEVAEENNQAVGDMFANPEEYGEGTDWFDVVTRVAPIENYSISFKGSNEKFSTSIVGGYFRQSGVLLNSHFERISLRANSDYRINDRVKVGLNLAPTFTNNSTPQSDGIWYNTGGIIQSAMLTSPLAPYKNPDGSIPLSVSDEYGTAAAPNWYNQVQIVKNTAKNVGLLSNAFAEVSILDNLIFKSSIGVDLGNTVSDSFYPSTAGSLFNPPNEADASRISGSHGNSYAYSWMFENTVSYNNTFGDHSFDVLAGYTSQAARSESGSMTGTGFPDNEVQTLNAAKTITGSTDIQEWSLASIVGRINYSFKNRYIISAAIRQDGSSKFGSDNRWGSFPSVSAGWVISDEAFMQSLTPVSFAKVRASYGITGNNNIGNYTQYANMVNTNNPFNDVYLSGKSVDGLNNTELGWETTKQWDIGVDFGLFDDRISLTYDYYRKVTNNLLYTVEIPISSGFYNFATNVGELEFWGHEVAVRTKNFTGPFAWNTDFNISFNRNKAVKLGTANAAIYGEYTITEVGQPLGRLYGLVWEGVYRNQEEYDALPKHQGSDVGTIRFKDVDGDGTVTNDDRDRTYIGNTAPKFTLGFTNTFAYKNFDLSIVAQGAFGNKIANISERFTGNLDGSFNVIKDLQNRWRSPEDPGNGRYGTTKSGTTGPERDWFSSKFVYDGSYLTIKNITLGYTLPAEKVKLFKTFRAYLSVQQAFVFTDYPGGNPEVSAAVGLYSGADVTTYPVPRTFTLGVNMTW
ncbi:SusC/RagA family TonB-linked outer membrane protein [Chondrinema litorale]|uniref:SusC/RagA family TonB-linked outer membrane protein n=1 Tax=Chondrinema litorale TaxID=2994555 RepID=UPI002542A855|nr:TonB-dependent receptor [Chondrinema litorale]UZR97376.1 TonB-dependent receptor [Chondrinema litorale]